MNKQLGVIAGAAVAVIVVAAGVAIAVSGGGGDTTSSGAPTTTTTTASTQAPSGGSNGGGNGGGDNQSSNGNNGGGGSSSNNVPPVIRDLQPFPDFGGDNCDNRPFLDLQGHAFDQDGSNDQQVQRAEISWGDNNSTTITTFANGAFVGSTHCYDSSFGGQTVDVHVKVVDEKGASAEQSVSVALPAS